MALLLRDVTVYFDPGEVVDEVKGNTISNYLGTVVATLIVYDAGEHF